MSSLREPEWFYDLHGAVRELISQHGDVPLLAARHLATSARAFDDVAEFDLISSDGRRTEIDLVAVVDGRLLVGEAKVRPVLDQGKRGSTISKLVRVADLLGADEIVLAAGSSGDWSDADISALKNTIASWRWRVHMAPGIRVLTGLATPSPNESLFQ